MKTSPETTTFKVKCFIYVTFILLINKVVHRLKAQLNDVFEPHAPGSMVFEPRLGRLRLSFSLNLLSLCTKFHLKWHLLNIYLLLYNKNTLENFEKLLYIIMLL
jgi:hypothetical protein